MFHVKHLAFIGLLISIRTMIRQEDCKQLIDIATTLKRIRKQPYRQIGITWNQFQVLKKLYTEESMHPSDMASYLGMDRPSMTIVLQTMEKKGWVVLRQDLKNKKYKVISLTEDGGKQYRTVKFQILEQVTTVDLLKDIPSEQREVISQALSNLPHL